VGKVGLLVGRSSAVRRQALWTLLAQVLSSTANFGLTIAVARAVDRTVGGAFTYAFVVFTLVIGFSRATTTDPLVIRFSAAAPPERKRARAQAAGSSFTVGLVAGLVCAAIGLVLGGELGIALAMLGVVLPGQLLQDSWRSAAFVSGRPGRAALNDGVRVTVQFAAIGLCILLGTHHLAWYMGSWALGAWAAAAFGVWQFGGIAGIPRSLRWLREHAGLSARLGSGYVVNMGSFTLTTSLLTGLLGLAATGALRFSQSVLGIIQVVFGAVTSFAVPLLARRLAREGPGALRRPSAALSVGAFALSLAVVVTFLLLPDAIGRELLGASWSGAREVMPAVGAAQCLNALALGGTLRLKALDRADLVLRVVSLQAPLILGLGVGGALVAGVVGAAWGLALAQLAGCLLYVGLARRATREAQAAWPA
jgi:O-antigen/teichoic acid export membrane protein